jgi:hypothetical protein
MWCVRGGRLQAANVVEVRVTKRVTQEAAAVALHEALADLSLPGVRATVMQLDAEAQLLIREGAGAAMALVVNRSVTEVLRVRMLLHGALEGACSAGDVWHTIPPNSQVRASGNGLGKIIAILLNASVHVAEGCSTSLSSHTKRQVVVEAIKSLDNDDYESMGSLTSFALDSVDLERPAGVGSSSSSSTSGSNGGEGGSGVSACALFAPQEITVGSTVVATARLPGARGGAADSALEVEDQLMRQVRLTVCGAVDECP